MSSAVGKLPYPDAVRALLDEFSWNPWFLNSYWPENEPRARFMTRIATEEFSDLAAPLGLEVGCANGYMAYLFRLLGFKMIAVDAYEDEKRSELFRKSDITYHQTNLNDVTPLIELASESFDIVLLGEVFEHILNQPAGLLRGAYHALRPGGLLILTTPNPSTLANGIRLLKDNYVLWGTQEFLRETKLNGEKVIDRGDIHYHEYPAWLVRELLTEVGFNACGLQYVPCGIAPTHTFVKRSLKRLIFALGMGTQRLFAPGYVIWARKPLSTQ